MSLMQREFSGRLRYSVSQKGCLFLFLEFFDHENIIELLDIQRPPAPTGYQDVYIITQLMEADLH